MFASMCFYDLVCTPLWCNTTDQRGGALHRLEGVPLSERQPTKAHGMAMQRALRALHNEGWVHGDLQPRNIMLFEGAGGAAGARLVDLGSSTGGATEEMRQAEESELASVFAAKVRISNSFFCSTFACRSTCLCGHCHNNRLLSLLV